MKIGFFITPFPGNGSTTERTEHTEKKTPTLRVLCALCGFDPGHGEFLPDVLLNKTYPRTRSGTQLRPYGPPSGAL
jgi:hypothetical protein